MKVSKIIGTMTCGANVIHGEKTNSGIKQVEYRIAEGDKIVQDQEGFFARTAKEAVEIDEFMVNYWIKNGTIQPL